MPHLTGGVCIQCIDAVKVDAWQCCSSSTVTCHVDPNIKQLHAKACKLTSVCVVPPCQVEYDPEEDGLLDEQLTEAAIKYADVAGGITLLKEAHAALADLSDNQISEIAQAPDSGPRGWAVVRAVLGTMGVLQPGSGTDWNSMRIHISRDLLKEMVSIIQFGRLVNTTAISAIITHQPMPPLCTTSATPVCMTAW